ncbi:MAG: Ldh family oxidoreductase [Acetobacterales bacterium]
MIAVATRAKMKQTQRFPAETIKRFTGGVFETIGLPAADAATVAHDLVEADLRGLASHGVARIPIYLRRIREGVVNPQPNITVEKITPVAVRINGDDGMGFLATRRAMAEATDIAREFGIGLAAVHRSTHFGMAALYVQQAIAEGCIGLVFTTSSSAIPVWGGRTPFLGAAPLAAGAPGRRGPGFLLDMAMTVVARGKIRLAAQRGESIPEGLALDAEGRPTTDARAAFEGVCLPFGGPKGAALSMLMDVLAGLFTGADHAGDVNSLYFDFSAPQNVGHLVLAMKPGLFVGEDTFRDRMDEMTDRIKALPRAAGFDEILIPGEPEERHRVENLRHGIPITDDVLAQLREEAAALHVPFPEAPAS